MKTQTIFNILTFGIKVFFAVVLFLLAISIAIAFCFSYESVTTALMDFYGKSDKLTVFQAKYLTLERYNIVRILLAISFIAVIAIFFYLHKISTAIASKITSLLFSIKNFWKYLKNGYCKISRAQKVIYWMVLLLVAIVKGYFLGKYYFHIDEISSYLYFVRNGFLVSITYYPGPNNHILYSAILSILKPLFSNPVYLMKVPALVLSIMVSAVFGLFLMKYFSYQVSLIGTLLLSFSGNFFIYSIFGRGYMLMCFFTLLAMITVLEIGKGKNEKFFWHMYTVSSILGFYTLLTYLYPFIAFIVVLIVLIVVKREYKLFGPFFRYHIYITIGVTLLYMPIILSNGYEALINNPWVAPLEWGKFIKEYPIMLHGAFDYISFIENKGLYVSLPIISTAVFLFIKTSRKELALLVVMLFILPFLILLIQHVIPFDRVWTYLIIPFIICLVVMLEFLYTRIKRFPVVSGVLTGKILILITAYIIYYSLENVRNGFQIYDQVGRISAEVMKKIKNTEGEVYTNEDVYNMYLDYYSVAYDVVKSATTDVNDPLIPFHTYYFVLLVPGTDFPAAIDKSKYGLKEKNSYIEVYELKP